MRLPMFAYVILLFNSTVLMSCSGPIPPSDEILDMLEGQWECEAKSHIDGVKVHFQASVSFNQNSTAQSKFIMQFSPPGELDQVEATVTAQYAIELSAKTIAYTITDVELEMVATNSEGETLAALEEYKTALKNEMLADKHSSEVIQRLTEKSLWTIDDEQNIRSRCLRQSVT